MLPALDIVSVLCVHSFPVTQPVDCDEALRASGLMPAAPDLTPAYLSDLA